MSDQLLVETRDAAPAAPVQRARSLSAVALRAGATGLAAFVVYAATVAPDLTWANHGGDGGELITAAVTLGVPHPHGYPTYVLLGKLASFIPLGGVAWRFNLLSAVYMAGAITAATAATAALLGPDDRARPLAAPAAGLLLAIAPLVWGQAVIAEVYALNMLVVALFLYAWATRRRPVVIGLWLGLAVTTHLTSLLLAPLALLASPPRRRPALLAGAAIGLLPLLAPPLLASGGSPVLVGDPSTPAGWWWLVSGRLYRPNVNGLPADALRSRILEWAPLLAGQLTWAAPLLVLTAVWRGGRPARALALTAGLYLLFALTYLSHDAELFLLPGLLLVTPLLGLALARLPRALLLLPLLSLGINFGAARAPGPAPLRARADAIFDAAPADAILFVEQDPATFALWYFHHVEAARPDVIIVDSNLLAADWYRRRLKRLYPDLEQLARDDPAGFVRVNQTRRPVCPITLALEMEPCLSTP